MQLNGDADRFLTVVCCVRIGGYIAQNSSVGLDDLLRLNSLIVIGWLTINVPNREIWLASEVVPLSTLQFDLLAYLACRAGQTIAPDELLREVWGVRAGGTDNQVDCCLKKLRHKIETRVDDPAYLHKRHGRYRLVTDAEWWEAKSRAEAVTGL